MEKQIHWYPGHMAKAYRLIKEKLPLIDCIIEVIDARIPNASLNKNIRETIGNKPLLRVMNKCDLADKAETDKWLKVLNESAYTIKLNSLTGDGNVKTISNALEVVLKDVHAKLKSQGKNIYPIRAMVIGVPNVGKSTLLNNLAKRKAMETGDRPGVTKAMQYLRANDKLLLLDNPGTLWPRLENERQGKLLALVGSIKDEILPLRTVASFSLDILKETYPNALKDRYGIEDSLNKTNGEIFTEIGKRRGCLLRGGEIDTDKALEIFLRELRAAKLGAMTFEKSE